jgi:hypothetical protein
LLESEPDLLGIDAGLPSEQLLRILSPWVDLGMTVEAQLILEGGPGVTYNITTTAPMPYISRIPYYNYLFFHFPQ